MKKRSRKKNIARIKRINHVKSRALRRYGVNLETSDILTIERMIRTGEALHLESASRTKSVHLVSYKGKKMPVAYDKNKHMACSVLPKEYYENWQRRQALSEGEV